MAKTDPIDPAVPAGSEDPKLGDNRIRELARAVAEILNKDHYIGANGGSGTGYNEDAAGEHNKVTLRATTKPTAVASKGFVYGKDVDGKIELFYEDEDGSEVQITTGGILNSCNLAGDQTIAGAKTFSGIATLVQQAVLTGGLTAAAALISTLANGTAPLTVVSATKVANLNADKVDGYDIAAYAGEQSYTFAGGFIIKQGEVASGAETTVTFGVAFPNDCVRVIHSINYPTWGASYASRLLSKSASNFVISVGGGGSRHVDWIAIGH